MSRLYPDQPSRHVSFHAERVWLLVNPRAGRGTALHVERQLTKRLRRLDIDVTVSHEHATHATPPWRPHCVIVIGGDGTLRVAVDRLVELYGLDVPPVLPVPMGTANLMGQHLGLRRTLAHIALDGAREVVGARRDTMERTTVRAASLLGSTARRVAFRAVRFGRQGLPTRQGQARQVAASAVASLLRGNARRLDVGRTKNGLFLLMAGVGFDAHVVAELDRRRASGSGAIGLTSYALPTAAAMMSGRFPLIDVHVDGRHVFGPAPALVMIANVSEYGTGIPIVPHARSDDGRLDVVCLPCRHAGDLLKLLVTTTAGWHVNGPGVVSVSGTRVAVTTPQSKPVDVQIDGDPGGTLPLEVELVPAAVPFVDLQ